MTMVALRSSLSSSLSTVDASEKGRSPIALCVALGDYLVDDICRHDSVNHKLSESLKVFFGLVDTTSERFIFSLHEHLPPKLDTVLFGDRLLVDLGVGCVFLDELSVGDTRVVNIVDDGRKDDRKLGSDVIP